MSKMTNVFKGIYKGNIVYFHIYYLTHCAVSAVPVTDCLLGKYLLHLHAEEVPAVFLSICI